MTGILLQVLYYSPRKQNTTVQKQDNFHVYPKSNRTRQIICLLRTNIKFIKLNTASWILTYNISLDILHSAYMTDMLGYFSYEMKIQQKKQSCVFLFHSTSLYLTMHYLFIYLSLVLLSRL